MINLMLSLSKKMIKSVPLAVIALLIVSCLMPFDPPAAKADLFQDILWEGGLEDIGNIAYDDIDPAAPQRIVANLIKVALTFLSIVFLVIVLYGGATWMTSAGNEEKVKKARQLIANGAIGVIIIISAWAITVFVLQNVIRSTQ